MEDFEIEYTMRMLRVAANFYEHGCLERLIEEMGDVELEPINGYELSYITMYLVFQDSRQYLNPGRRVSKTEWTEDREVMVLRDPLLSKYDALCREYEKKSGISKVENDFARELESTVHTELRYDSYCYDYSFIDSTQDRKGPKILMFLDEEFDGHFAVSESLFNILDFCKSNLPKLEEAIRKADRKLKKPAMLKEAA